MTSQEQLRLVKVFEAAINRLVPNVGFRVIPTEWSDPDQDIYDLKGVCVEYGVEPEMRTWLGHYDPYYDAVLVIWLGDDDEFVNCFKSTIFKSTPIHGFTKHLLDNSLKKRLAIVVRALSAIARKNGYRRRF